MHPADFSAALLRLRAWVAELRPQAGEAPEARLSAFLDQLRDQPELRASLTADVHALLGHVRAVDALSSAGILSEGSLREELTHRLLQRLLPPVPDDSTLEGALAVVFHRPGDAAWLAGIPASTWARLQGALGLEVDPATPIPRDLALAIRVLAHRIAALGLRPALTSRVPDLSADDSPFLCLSDQVLAYVRSHGNDREGDEAPLLRACVETLARCRERVEELRANKRRYGTSLELTALSFRMMGLIERVSLLLRLTDPERPRAGEHAGALLVALVRAEEDRHLLFPMVRQHADLLLYQVVEHAARKGRRYITTTRAEYGRFLLSSMGGGLIVALFAMLKVKLAAVHLPLAGQALAFSLNYAACFVLIYVTGATLATKQPAVTAHTLAATLDRSDGSHDVARLAEMVARAWRSQLVSLVGNVAMAFPVGLLLAVGWRLATGHALADPDKATRLLADVHPWQGPTLWFAAIAGVYLFGAGLVSGWVDNRMVYSKVPARIAAHPLLVGLLGRQRAAGIARFTDEKAGALIGNIFLGFCLGATGILGHILGLPLDIRHIAFASAHMAMGLDALSWAPAAAQVATLAAGVGLIGLVNLFVSFGLALFIAMESRQLSLHESRDLLRQLWRLLLTQPLCFLFPPRSPEEHPHEA